MNQGDFEDAAWSDGSVVVALVFAAAAIGLAFFGGPLIEKLFFHG